TSSDIVSKRSDRITVERLPFLGELGQKSLYPDLVFGSRGIIAGLEDRKEAGLVHAKGSVDLSPQQPMNPATPSGKFAAEGGLVVEPRHFRFIVDDGRVEQQWNFDS